MERHTDSYLAYASRVARAAEGANLNLAPSGNAFRMTVNGMNLSWRREDDDVYAEIALRTTINLASGSPQPAVETPHPRYGVAHVFVSGIASLDPTAWLDRNGAERLASLGLDDNDSLLVGRNGVWLQFRSRGSATEDGLLLRKLAALAADLPADTVPPGAFHLPDSLSDLQRFVEDWAIGDDLKRSEAVASASTEDLEDFWHAVQPLLPRINGVLDDDGDLDPGARAAGHLAQAALEAELELERRRGVE